MADMAVVLPRRKVVEFIVALLSTAELWAIPTVLTGWITGIFGVHMYSALGIAVYAFFFHNGVPGDAERHHFGPWTVSLFGLLVGGLVGGVTYAVGSLFG